MDIWNRFVAWCGLGPAPAAAVAAPELAAPAAAFDPESASLEELIAENLRLGAESDLIRAQRVALNKMAAQRRLGA